MLLVEEKIIQTYKDLLSMDLSLDDTYDHRYYLHNLYQYQNNFQGLLDHFKKLNCSDQHIILYRGLDTDEDIRIKKNIGVCWTFNPKKAYCYGAKTKNSWYWYVHGIVHIDDVNWLNTIRKALGLWPYENEVEIFIDRSIELIKLEKRRKTLDFLIDDNFKGFMSKT